MRHGCCMPSKMDLPKPAHDGELTDYEALKAAQKLILNMGYDYLESRVESIMDLTESELSGAKADGLTVNSYNCFYPGNMLIADLSDEIFERAEQAVRRASMLGGRCIVFGSGSARRIPEDMSPDEGMKRIETFLNELDKLCDKYNMLVAIEPLSEPTTIIRSVSEAVDLIEKIKSKNIFALADVYHMYVVKENLDVLIRAAKYLRHIHIAEPINRGYPGCKKGEYLMAFANMLYKIGYNGDVTVECKFDNFSTEAVLSAQFMKRYF